MKGTRYRWVVTGLIFFITLINFIDRSAISFVIEPLKREFNFTDTQFGMILSAFGVGYVLLTAFGGWLVDVLGARIVWPLAAIGWSLCVGFLGLAESFLGFIVLRLVLGITEGPHFPSMSQAISNWLPNAERARALSLGLVAIPVSSVIGAPIASYLVADFGWRVMFMAISSVGIVWAVIWYFLFRDDPKDSKYVNETELKLITGSKDQGKKDPIDWRFILTHPALIANNFAYFAYGYMLFFATLWLPGYFLSHHGLNLKSVGLFLVIPWAVAAIFLKTGGVLSDFLYRKTGNSRLARSHIIWSSQLLSALFFLLLGFTNSLALSIFFLSLGLGFGQLPQPAFFSVNIDIAKERAASAQGVTSSFLSLAGIIAPFITGWLIGYTKTYQAAFLLLGALTLVSVIVVIFFHHPEKKRIPKTA